MNQVGRDRIPPPLPEGLRATMLTLLLGLDLMGHSVQAWHREARQRCMVHKASSLLHATAHKHNYTRGATVMEFLTVG